MEGVVQADGFTQRAAGPVSGGRQQSSGSGPADGGHLRPARSGLHYRGPRFDCAVPHGGYVWWYIDAVSDDGAHALTLIAFVGSVFSPYYASARRRGEADPLNHCAINMALYGPRSGRWAMTERGAMQVEREQSILSIGSSILCWTGNALLIAIDEVCAPLPRRLRGSVRLTPAALCDRSFALDTAGLHRWSPIAPCARIEVDLSDPALSWSGSGYLDSNSGAGSLEDAFETWSWSRASVADRTLVLYDIKARETAARSMALQFDANGTVRDCEMPPPVPLPCTGWRLSRQTRADAGQNVRVARTLEDGPFYSRSLLSTSLLGATAPAIHESLSLDRFRSRWVQCLLPFRMPRNARPAAW
jgi:carotenoid 1,2-hydratase